MMMISKSWFLLAYLCSLAICLNANPITVGNNVTTELKHDSGKEVSTAQAYAYTNYLGKLNVQFNQTGNIMEYDGTPIRLNTVLTREDDVVQQLEFIPLETKVVGHTKVHLEGRSEICRSRECNLGNLITDSMIYARVLENQGGLYWTDAAIAFIEGGGIGSSIDKRSDGSIYDTDVLAVLPSHNDLYITRISGRTLLKALEHSASMEAKDSNGGFLQMSGIYTSYYYEHDVGNRVVSAIVRCSECNVPAYEPLDLNKMYNVIVPESLKDGAQGYTFTEGNGYVAQRLQKNLYDTLLQYLSHREFIYPEVEERITIRSGMSSVASSAVITVMALLAILFAN